MRLAGLFIFILLLVSCHRRHNKLAVLFDNVDGIKKGTDVYCKGIIVGKVTSFNVNLYKTQVVVDITLTDSIRIPAESKFIINPSIFGSAHITIEPSGKTNFLTSADTVTGEYSSVQKFDDLTSDTTKQRKARESFEKIGEGIKELIESAKDSGKSQQ